LNLYSDLTTDDADITDFFSHIRAHPGNPWFYPAAALASKKAQALAWA